MSADQVRPVARRYWPERLRFAIEYAGGAVIPLAVLLIVGSTLAWVAYDEYLLTEETEYKLLEAHARNVDVQVGDTLGKIERLLNRIADERLQQGSLQQNAFTAVFDRYRDDIPELEALLMTDASGVIRASTDAAIIGRDVSREPYYTVHFDHGRPPRMFMSRPDKHLLSVTSVAFTLPIVGTDRQFLGIVGVTVGFRFFPSVVQEINSDDSAGMAVIFNRDGDLLFRRENQQKFFGSNIAATSRAFREHFNAGRLVTRHVFPSSRDGITRLYLVRDVGNSGLSLILTRQLNSVLAKWKRNIVIYIVIFALTSVAVVSFAVVATRRKRKILADKDVLSAAKQRAEDASLAKSRFLAAASHDLRQPIYAQGLFLDVLSRTELTAQQRELLTSACAAGNASAELLSKLLDYSRLDAGVIEPQLQTFRLQPVLNKLERECESQADAKGLFYRSRETELAVHSDPMLVELILRNLIFNAIRYTERGGLLVACRKRGAQAVLEVWDTGIGIDQAHQQEIFREFHQLGNPERDRRKGLGLGLAIANGLARTLGHELTLASAPRRGSVFRLFLPIASGPSLDGLHQTRSQAQLLNVRVLVIDDDESVRVGMLCLLRDWGCECEAAESIEEALALARMKAPDVVVSDYRLREQRTGLEAIAALRALLGARLPALLITGDTAPDRLREAQASGIPLLHKPVSPSQLYRGLASILPH